MNPNEAFFRAQIKLQALSIRLEQLEGEFLAELANLDELRMQLKTALPVQGEQKRPPWCRAEMLLKQSLEALIRHRDLTRAIPLNEIVITRLQQYLRENA